MYICNPILSFVQREHVVISLSLSLFCLSGGLHIYYENATTVRDGKSESEVPRRIIVGCVAAVSFYNA